MTETNITTAEAVTEETTVAFESAENATVAVESAADTETKEAVGLARLQADFQDLNLDLLSARLPDNFDDTTKGVDEIYAATQKVQETVTSVLKWLAGKDAYLAGIKDPMKKRIAVGEVGKKQDEAMGKLDLCLGHSVPYFKLAAALAYIKYCFGQTYKTINDARTMLADLVSRDILTKIGNGAIQIAYERYELGKNFGFERDDTVEITKWIGEYSRRLMTLIKQERESDKQQMQQEANITPEDVWDNPEAVGVCLFNVPPESYVRYIDGEPKEQWRGGGPLQVHVTQKEIIPLSGKGGSLEKQVALLKEHDVRLARHTLKWDCPPGGDGSNSPGSKQSYDRIIDGVMRFRDMDAEEAAAYIGKMRMLWHLIIRAYHGLDAAAEQAALKEELLGLATITPEAFFGLNGSSQPEDGDALLEFEGCFQVTGKSSVFEPFALMRRSKQDDRSVVEILRIPPHMHEFFGAIVGKRFSEGEAFRELPKNMGRFVRAVKGRVEMAHAVTE